MTCIGRALGVADSESVLHCAPECDMSMLCAWRRQAVCGSALMRCRKELGAVWVVPARAMRSRLRPHVEGKIGEYDRGTGFGIVEYNSKDGQRVLRRALPGTICGESVIFRRWQAL